MTDRNQKIDKEYQHKLFLKHDQSGKLSLLFGKKENIINHQQPRGTPICDYLPPVNSRNKARPNLFITKNHITKKTAVLIEKQPLKTAYRSIAKQGKKILIIGDCFIGRICQNKFTNSFWHAKVHLKFLMVQQLRI